MIRIEGIVLDEGDTLAGYLVNENGRECIMSEETLAEKAKAQEVVNGEVKKEFYGGKDEVLVDIGAEVTENILYKEEAISKYGQII